MSIAILIWVLLKRLKDNSGLSKNVKQSALIQIGGSRKTPLNKWDQRYYLKHEGVFRGRLKRRVL